VSDLVKDKATICIINYKTLDFTKLCLRSIRKFTHFPYEVIVVDNNSGDESLEYLRSLDWIRLIERDTSNDVSGGHAHSAGLDLGLENCNTEFFISMHSDTFVIKDGWLGDLIAPMTSDRDIVCLGTGKIELTPKWQILVKNATDFKTFRRKLLRTPDPLGKYRYYNRTICAIYRTDIMKELNLSFQADREKGQTSGKKLYFDFIDKGYKTIELPSAVFGKYLIHLAHATQVVNPSEFTLRGKTVRKCNRLVKKIMSSGIIKSIIEDGSLDK
jgi:glycosyltransferase involved in cell wall biosynthesis